MEIEKNTSSSGKLLQENCGKVFFKKTCVNFELCYGNPRWAEVVEKLFFQISLFKI